jgi:type I restriction enzyme, S subunit
MSEMKVIRLGDISEDVSYGYTESANEKPVGPKFLRITDIRNGSIEWDKVPYCVINEKEYLKNKIEIGDIVIARTGATTGITATIKNNVDAVFASYLIRFRINKSMANPFFVGHVLKSQSWNDYVSSIVGGSAQPGANAKQFSDFSFKLPPLPTQTAIAEILSSLDDKIELNNKINQELESLAQTLFKQWFVDFEFPNENGEPYKSSGGEMVDSELGEIPKGWEVKTLADISNITIGRTPPRQEHQWFSTDFNDYKWISIRDMGNCGTYIYSTSECLTEEAVIKFNVPVIDTNTVILSFKLTVGRVSITTERMVSNEAIAHLNLKGTVIFPEFLYLYLKQFNFDTLGSTSSIATAVNSKSIKSIPLISPNQEVLIKFKELVLSIFSRINNLTFENRDLTNLRDTLLPKLISGELEINEISN